MIILAHRPNMTDIKYAHASRCLADALALLRQKSRTAAEIIRYVEQSRVRVQIVVAEEEGVFGPFNPQWAFVEPCIIWAPNIEVPVRATDVTGYYQPSGNPKVSGKKQDIILPPEIVLIHELGHAKQYIDHPDWYASGATTPGTKTSAEIEAHNLRWHEVPVCKEFGLKQRARYDDFLPSNETAMPHANSVLETGYP